MFSIEGGIVTMSEDARTTNPEATNDKFKDFKLEISGAKFEPILDSKFMLAKEFGEIVSNIFKEIFVDWEGCTISDVKGTSFISLNFFFNHNELPETEGKVRAITRDMDTGTQNDVLNRVRRFNNTTIHGDRYYLTEFAQKCFQNLLIDGINGLRGQHGNINWTKAVSEVAENVQRNYPMYGQIPSQQYTVLSFIDPSKIATEIYGEEDVDGGAKWCYQVIPVNTMPVLNQFGQQVNPMPTDPANRIFRIDRVSAKELNVLANKLGFSMIGNGLNIIR